MTKNPLRARILLIISVEAEYLRRSPVLKGLRRNPKFLEDHILRKDSLTQLSELS